MNKKKKREKTKENISDRGIYFDCLRQVQTSTTLMNNNSNKTLNMHNLEDKRTIYYLLRTTMFLYIFSKFFYSLLSMASKIFFPYTHRIRRARAHISSIFDAIRKIVYTKNLQHSFHILNETIFYSGWAAPRDTQHFTIFKTNNYETKSLEIALSLYCCCCGYYLLAN